MSRFKLMDILRPEHLTFLQRQPELQGLQVGLIEVEWVDRDGSDQVRASIHWDGSYWFSSERYIQFDKADFPQRIPYPFEIDDYRDTLASELAHCARSLSFFGRFKMWYENTFIKDYHKRSHEIKDHEIGEVIAGRWGKGQ